MWQPDARARLVWTAQERERIRLVRAEGQPRPWTADPVLASGRFCNVWREHDKTSVVILSTLRAHKRELRPALACGLRLINRHATLLQFRPGQPLRAEMDRLVGLGINTNAYRINTPLGLNNKAGVRLLMDRAEAAADDLALLCAEATSFRQLARDFNAASGLGRFITYQVLLDLRDLGQLSRVADDWAYPGPGAARGLARLRGDYAEVGWAHNAYRLDRRAEDKPGSDLNQMIRLTPLLREMTGWPRWSIHETEGWLCEWDKYERLRARAGLAS